MCVVEEIQHYSKTT